MLIFREWSRNKDMYFFITMLHLVLFFYFSVFFRLKWWVSPSKNCNFAALNLKNHLLRHQTCYMIRLLHVAYRLYRACWRILLCRMFLKK